MSPMNVRIFALGLVPALVLWACVPPPTGSDHGAAAVSTATKDAPSREPPARGGEGAPDHTDVQPGDEEQTVGCGDAVCRPGETCSTCPADCGVCAPNDAAAPAADACVAPTGLQLQDQDFSDHQVPWRRTGAGKVVIFFETKNVAAEYVETMEQGVANWNRSPCLDTRLIDTCPAGANCVTVRAPNPNTDGDGNFDSVERDGFTVGGHIDVVSGLTKGERINVMVHEMGHAVGLRHRKADRVLMNPDTFDDVFASDPVDYQNLLVLYGRQK